ncbi:MAG: glyoxalase/bleomycin resistance protein/dioxygenase family protein [Hymenobacter sp.]|nr:glyoxalase/bleomycin resistance protein/dioxygenase family protein [Hymenobacter sp.]
MPTLTAIVPQLPSTGLERTSQFYRQKLGFREVGRYPDLLILKWGEQELQFWLTTDATLASMSSCYVRVADIGALYKVYAAVPGLLRSEHALAVRPWGMNEFNIIDPDGNLLKFGEPVAWEPEPGPLPEMPAFT